MRILDTEVYECILQLFNLGIKNRLISGDQRRLPTHRLRGCSSSQSRYGVCSVEVEKTENNMNLNFNLNEREEDALSERCFLLGKRRPPQRGKHAQSLQRR